MITYNVPNLLDCAKMLFCCQEQEQQDRRKEEMKNAAVSTKVG